MFKIELNPFGNYVCLYKKKKTNAKTPNQKKKKEYNTFPSNASLANQT